MCSGGLSYDCGGGAARSTCRRTLLMLKVFQANPMIHQFSEILKITLLLESGMKRYVICKKT